MEQTVVLTSVAYDGGAKVGKRGPYHFRVFETSGGSKFQTLDPSLGDQLVDHFNLPIDLTYVLEDSKDGKFQNNVIKGWKPASEQAAATAVAVQAQASEPVPPTSTSSQDEFRRSKEEMRYTEAVKAAAVVLASDQDFSVEQLKQMADAIAELIAEPR